MTRTKLTRSHLNEEERKNKPAHSASTRSRMARSLESSAMVRERQERESFE